MTAALSYVGVKQTSDFAVSAHMLGGDCQDDATLQVALYWVRCKLLRK